MNRCRCQSPPAWADGGSWRSGSPAAGLSQPGMPERCSGFVRTAIADNAIAVRLAARKPDAGNAARQPPPPAKSGRPARSSRPAACVPATSHAGARDGSRFPFGHFSGTIRLWRNDHHAGCGSRCDSSLPGRTGKAARSLAALLDLWPARPLRRSFPTDSTTKVSFR